MSKIDYAPAQEALELLRIARKDVQEIVATSGGLVAFDVVADQMLDRGWMLYDTRLALASAGVKIDAETLLSLEEVPYEV